MDSQGETCCEKLAVNSWLLLELSDRRRFNCARPSVSPAERKIPKISLQIARCEKHNAEDPTIGNT